MNAFISRAAATRLWAVPLTLMAGCLSGCGDKESDFGVALHPVRGLVRWNNQPLAGARVMFHPILPGSTVPRPHAVTREDGTFELATFRSGDGAPEGGYRVTISCRGPYDGKSEDRDEAPELLPTRYQDPDRSGIFITVVPGENTLIPWELSP